MFSSGNRPSTCGKGIDRDWGIGNVKLRRGGLGNSLPGKEQIESIHLAVVFLTELTKFAEFSELLFKETYSDGTRLWYICPIQQIIWDVALGRDEGAKCGIEDLVFLENQKKLLFISLYS